MLQEKQQPVQLWYLGRSSERHAGFTSRHLYMYPVNPSPLRRAKLRVAQFGRAVWWHVPRVHATRPVARFKSCLADQVDLYTILRGESRYRPLDAPGGGLRTRPLETNFVY